MQKDGNLVLYSGSGSGNRGGVIWNSKSYQAQEGNYFMAIQEDGNLVVYKGTPEKNHKSQYAIWNTGTYGARRNYFLSLQNDGTVAIYSGTPDNKKGRIWMKPK